MDSSRKKFLILTVSFEGGLAILAWLLGISFGVPAFQKLYFQWDALLWGILGTIPPLIALLWVSYSRWSVLVQFRQTVKIVVIKLFSNKKIIDFIIISLLAGL